MDEYSEAKYQESLADPPDPREVKKMKPPDQDRLIRDSLDRASALVVLLTKIGIDELDEHDAVGLLWLGTHVADTKGVPLDEVASLVQRMVDRRKRLREHRRKHESA